MPRGNQSPRKTQSVFVGGGGCRSTSPDLVFLPTSAAAAAAAVGGGGGGGGGGADSGPPTPRERHPPHAVVVPRPLSLASDGHAAAYLYSCHAPYARYFVSTPSPCLGITCRMKEAERSPSPGIGSGRAGPRGSVASLSSLGGSAHDELFRSPRHAEAALRRMEAYYNRGQLCDVTLVAGNRRIRAHRLVLSAASDYFAAMFTSPVLEATQEEVVMRDMDSDALHILVNYCYTGTLELNEDNVEVVMSTAHHLLLTEVVNVCCDFLTKQLHPANCLGIQLFADSQGCSELHRVASTFTAEHFQEVVQHQEFVQLPTEEAARLLASEDLDVPSEELIFQALVVWLKYDLENRSKDMARLLGLVKLPLLSPQFLADHIETNMLFKEDRECQELIVEALKYHLLPERRSTLQSPRTKPRKSTVGALFVVGGTDSNKGGWRASKTDHFIFV